jgi:probable F420-dependent oxidoreductase
MKFGISTFVTDYGISPYDLGELVEQLGFESLFFAEHSHIPASRKSRFPYAIDINQAYWRNFDPFIALTAVSLATSRLLIGTGICLVVQRDPIILAKEVSSIDQISHGRFLFGVGGGWNLEEMENHGTDASLRWKIMRERIEAMKTIWAQDEPSYHGQFVGFDPIWQWPKPLQKPHPPILVAGDGPNTLQRVVRYGDGWMPLAMYDSASMDEFKKRIVELRRLAAEAGRAQIPVTVGSVPPQIDSINRYEEAGVERILFWLPSTGKDETMSILERFANVVAQLM